MGGVIWFQLVGIAGRSGYHMARVMYVCLKAQWSFLLSLAIVDIEETYEEYSSMSDFSSKAR